MDCTSSRSGPMCRELSILLMFICVSSSRSIIAVVALSPSTMHPRSLNSANSSAQSVHSSRISVKRSSIWSSLLAALEISSTSRFFSSRLASRMLKSRKDSPPTLRCLPVAFISMVQWRERMQGWISSRSSGTVATNSSTDFFTSVKASNPRIALGTFLLKLWKRASADSIPPISSGTSTHISSLKLPRAVMTSRCNPYICSRCSISFSVLDRSWYSTLRRPKSSSPARK
mmetsp:Transcript_2729/g.9183  ORF Transcript_2729/g.9183 Transcript_2729/m.9183 type:complete len:230 (+) Transcript_2729:1288-1977(+)